MFFTKFTKNVERNDIRNILEENVLIRTLLEYHIMDKGKSIDRINTNRGIRKVFLHRIIKKLVNEIPHLFT